MHRDLASFDIYAIVLELQTLSGSFIDQIYQRQPDELFIRLNIKNQKQKPTIYIKNEQLIALTTKKFTMPQKPTTFAMTLRKHLQNGILTEIKQHDFDRIITLTITKYTTTFTIVIELFSNGNILLLDENQTILLPLKTQEWSHRSLRAKKTYQPPPTPTNPFSLTYDKFHGFLTAGRKDLVRTLAGTLNIGGAYAEELCTRAHIDKNTPLTDLTQNDIQILFSSFNNILSIFTQQKFQPTKVYSKDILLTILPFPFLIYQDENYQQQPTLKITTSLSDFIEFTPPSVKREQTDKYHAQQERLKRQLTQQHQTIKDSKEKIIQTKQSGELIYLHYQSLTELLTYIQKHLQEKEKTNLITTVSVHPLVKKFDPTANELIVTLIDHDGTSHDLLLDFRKSAPENANVFYNKSKKLLEKL
ncbi:MAG: NFACT family protein, partial [Candidatus Thermoplasmatota archaeon]|nr:NFACT family protein [Candidatus Thermoplasmatota archaeon]